jgi:hypothetical protein
MTHHLDTLRLQTADGAVELSDLKQVTQDHIDSIINDPLMFTPTIISTVNTVFDRKLRDLSMLNTRELNNSPTIQCLRSRLHESSTLSSIHQVTLASDSLQDLETFYDTIQSHFATVCTSSNIFPKYKALQATFNFHAQLCSSTTNPNLASSKL